MNEIEKEVVLMNKIIHEAIWHGADRGGSYDQNEDGLKCAINAWLHYKRIDNEYCIGKMLSEIAHVEWIAIVKTTEVENGKTT